VAAASATTLPTSGTTDAEVLASIPTPPPAITTPVATIITDAHTDAFLLGRPRSFSRHAAARFERVSQAAEQQARASQPVTALAMNPQFATILSKHNTYRSRHQAEPLQWSDFQASRAAEYASKCRWGHDPNAQAGENLYATSSKSDPTGALTAAIDAWCVPWWNYDKTLMVFVASMQYFCEFLESVLNVSCRHASALLYFVLFMGKSCTHRYCAHM